MPYVLPVTNNPCRRITVELPNGVYSFRTYWSGDVERTWKADILDGIGNPVLTGMALTQGCDLLKGCGLAVFDGWRLKVIPTPGFDETNPASLGAQEALVLFTPDEGEALEAAYEAAVSEV